ncbi:MAG: hypothetical protein D6748_04510 [Calditrichaeota bacterium]|nr:MAG: hypothetical protein D6748_04510 [Calditrichota bacterium]
MKSLRQIRKAYEENYQKMQEIIQQMGGDQYIKEHRKSQSPLYRKLRELQRKEHMLDEMETRLLNKQITYH